MKIWIIDDDKEMSAAVQCMLNLLDHEAVLFVGARPAAQALLAGERPDLIILDVFMPEVRGEDFLEFVRRREKFANIPVVMLSTEAADITIDHTLELGADAYITKPVAMDELDRAIKKACKAHGFDEPGSQ